LRGYDRLRGCGGDGQLLGRCLGCCRGGLLLADVLFFLFFDPLLLELALFGQSLLLEIEQGDHLLAHGVGGLRVERAEVGLDLLPEAVQELQDQGALHLELLGKLVNPLLRHPYS
jgi:hypothetical protein